MTSYPIHAMLEGRGAAAQNMLAFASVAVQSGSSNYGIEPLYVNTAYFSSYVMSGTRVYLKAKKSFRMRLIIASRPSSSSYYGVMTDYIRFVKGTASSSSSFATTETLMTGNHQETDESFLPHTPVGIRNWIQDGGTDEIAIEEGESYSLIIQSPTGYSAFAAIGMVVE